MIFYFVYIIIRDAEKKEHKTEKEIYVDISAWYQRRLSRV